MALRGSGGRDLGVRQLGRGPHRRRRTHLRPLLRAEPVGQRAVPWRPAGRPPGPRGRLGGGQPGRPARVLDRARRHRRGERVGLGRVLGRRRRAGRRRQAAERPGRGPLRGEAPHRGLPGPLRPTAGRGHPGPGWRRPCLRHRRDGGPGRGRHGRRRHRGAPARGGDGALGGDDQREPGADAGHRHPGRLAGGVRGLRALGGPGHRRRGGHRRGRAPAHPPGRRRAGAG